MKHKGVFAALSATLVVSCALPALAEDAADFQAGTDTLLSLQYQKVKAGKKSDKQCLAIYKVLDIQKVTGSYGNADVKPTQGDLIELAYTCNDKQEATGSGNLPWAELNSDGMVRLHMPKKYIRLRATTSAEKIWRIDNKDNSFAVVKPKGE